LVKSMVVAAPDSPTAFNPYLATTLPRLQRFGFNYDPYLAVLPAKRSYPLGEWISFAEQGDTVIRKGRGWWNTEAWGTWSSDEAAVTVNFAVPVDSDLLLEIVAGGFVNTKNPNQQVLVLVNNASVGEWDFHYTPEAEPYQQHDLVVSKEILNRQQPPVVSLRVSGAHSPAELGLSGDPRKLGLAMIKMRFVACTGDVCSNAAAQATGQFGQINLYEFSSFTGDGCEPFPSTVRDHSHAPIRKTASHKTRRPHNIRFRPPSCWERYSGCCTSGCECGRGRTPPAC